MNKFESIIKASNSFIKTIKKLIGLTKTSYGAKLAKAKAWHEFKKLTNSEYFEGLIGIVVGFIRHFAPAPILAVMIRAFFLSLQELT
jgi:hypothetical protein